MSENPNYSDELVFECSTCGKELDPHTTSFQKLCTHANEEGWVMKWYDLGYKTTCKECLK